MGAWMISWRPPHLIPLAPVGVGCDRRLPPARTNACPPVVLTFPRYFLLARSYNSKRRHWRRTKIGL